MGVHVSSGRGMKISPVDAFPRLSYVFPLLTCITAFLHTNLLPSVYIHTYPLFKHDKVQSSKIVGSCAFLHTNKCLPPYLMSVSLILGLQPRDKAAMLGVKTKEYFLEEFT